MTPTELEEIQKRADAATPGPWEPVHHDSTAPEEFWCVHLKRASPSDPEEESTPRWDKADVSFLAHARTDIPALVAEVKRLRAIIDEYIPCKNGGSHCSDPAWFGPGERCVMCGDKFNRTLK